MDDNNKTKQLNENDLDNVSGGRRGFWKEIKILSDYCDYCGEKIDGETRYDVHINVPDKIMCNRCFERQVVAMGREAAVKKWMDIAPSPNGNINIDINKNIKK